MMSLEIQMKILVLESLLNKANLSSLQQKNLSKVYLPINFAKFLKNVIFKENLQAAAPEFAYNNNSW